MDFLTVPHDQGLHTVEAVDMVKDLGTIATSVFKVYREAQNAGSEIFKVQLSFSLP